ncbi:MAG: PKD domain-containing protein, partial [Gemmatimonadetes bacterium]|nr:PKD domain-containing protein [Gemmatimonadota bacterium]
TFVITVLFVPVASVDVSPASGTIAVGASIQLTAQPKDEVGNPLAGRVVTWSSSNTGVATVAADGLVTGVGEGTATITATSETKSGDAAIEVYAPPPGSTPPNFKVAFIGDQDDGSGAMNVLRLIRDEGTDMVIHLGDFDYSSDPDGWDNLITSVLGFDYPYFATIGNHDTGEWSTYQQKLEERLARVDGATCTGDLGVKSACTYQGLFFILSGAGTRGSGHESYIRQELSQDNSDWRICSWHKVQREMQVGGKSSSVGWGPYRACREEGAIIATAHEHSYSRTKTLVSMEQQIVDPDWPDPNDVYVGPGATFAFVSGLGGKSIRDQERCKPTTYPYGCKGEWANIYTSDQNAKFGALFIEFHVDGDPGKARGYFKNVNGQIIDEFTITGTGVSSNSAPTVGGVLDQTTDEGATTTLAATFSDADTEDTHTASIDWGDGTPAEAGTVSKLVVPWTVSATHAYADDGDYTVTVSVSDGRGGVGQGSYTVTVSNVAPTAVAGGPYSGDEGSPISFSGSATDPGADALTFEWDFDYDGVTFIANGGGASPQHTYLQDGEFTVALRVSDDDGGVSGVATAPVTIKDTDPMADFSFSPAAPTIGDPVSFTDASTSYDGITSWEWNFDIFDISSGLDLLSIEQNPSHTYDVAGIYTVRLTVREADGDVSTVDKQVEVGEQLVTSTVLYFSLSKSTTVGGLSVANEDIIAFDGTGFSKYFDGSDVGVGGHRIDGFVIISSNEIIMSFSSSGSVPGISGTVDDSDIVKFTATSLGTNTAGSFELYFDGSDVGLTRSGEDIDAIELLPDGRLLISTRGSFSVPGLSGKDEDISVFTPTSLGPTTAGTWARYFDGSDVSLGSSSDEDIYALAVDATGKIYLSTKGNFSVSGLSGHDEDVFVFTPSSLGSSTAGTFDSTLFFDGSAYGLSSNDIYGIDLR